MSSTSYSLSTSRLPVSRDSARAMSALLLDQQVCHFVQQRTTLVDGGGGPAAGVERPPGRLDRSDRVLLAGFVDGRDQRRICGTADLTLLAPLRAAPLAVDEQVGHATSVGGSAGSPERTVSAWLLIAQPSSIYATASWRRSLSASRAAVLRSCVDGRAWHSVTRAWPTAVSLASRAGATPPRPPRRRPRSSAAPAERRAGTSGRRCSSTPSPHRGCCGPVQPPRSARSRARRWRSRYPRVRTSSSSRISASKLVIVLAV